MNPYIGCIFNDQNPVDVIGHDAIFIQSGIREMAGNALPISFGNLSYQGENRFFIFDGSQNQFSVSGADGHEIFYRCGIVVSTQTYGPAALDFGIEFHSDNVAWLVKIGEYQTE